MTKHQLHRATGPISAIADLSGRRQEDVYRLMRLEGAPSAVSHVGGVLVYYLDEALRHVSPDGPPCDAHATRSPSPNPEMPRSSPDSGV